MKRVILNGQESNYFVSEDGEVFSEFLNRNLKPQKVGGNQKRDRYLLVRLSMNGEYQQIYLHRLVAEHYLDCPDNYQDLQINHKDLDKQNNHFSNLEWVTAKENIHHRYGLTGMTDEEILIRRKVLAKQYYIDNKEKISEVNKEWYNHNKDRMKEVRRKWRNSNPDKVKITEEQKLYQKEYQKEWRKNNPDYQKEYHKDYNKKRVRIKE